MPPMTGCTAKAKTCSWAMDVLVCRYLPAGNVYGERVP